MTFLTHSENVALKWLKEENWNLDNAIESYFNRTGGNETLVFSKGSQDLFEKYKKIGLQSEGAQEIDGIQLDGLVQLITDLGFGLEDFAVLVLFWKMKAKTQFQIQKDEFLKGMAELGCDSLQKLKNLMSGWTREVKGDNYKLKQLYIYLFDYNKAPNAKTLPVELAVALWNVILKDKYKRLQDWIDFVQGQYKKAITKDVWTQFFEFTITINTDFSNYEEDGAWPVIIDEFIEYCKKKK